MANWTGVGRYVTALGQWLPRVDPDNEYLLLLNPGEDAAGVPESERLRKVRCRRPIAPYSVAEQLRLKGEIARFAPDLVHAPQFNVPRLGALPFVVTIQDLIYLLFPEDAPSRVAAVGARWAIRSAVRRARRIVAISEHTKSDLVERLKVDPARILVTPLAPPELAPPGGGTGDVRERFGLRGDFLLYTGNHAPHKNLKTLLAALAILAPNRPGLILVVTGRKDRHTPAVEAEAALRGVADRVVFTGRVEDDELGALYAAARVLVFPSLYEGFGIPPLEAFAAGTPVVASRAASIPEVLGDSALLVDPLDAAGFAAAVGRLLDDEALSRACVEKGRARLARYSWEATARATLEAYRP